VVGSNKGGILVQFGRLQGFVPQSHLTSIPRGTSQEDRYEAKKRLIGDTLNLKVLDIDRQKNRLVLSQRAARREARQKQLAELEVGAVRTGRVVSLKSYGAFVEIGGGIDGLLHVSEIAWHHVPHPGDVLSVGDEVEVLIKEVEVERERVSLSRKARLPNPWDSVSEDLPLNALVTGTVTNTADFGVFMALPSGLEGLVHISEMSTFGGARPEELVRKGDDVLVRVTGVEPERQRISLSMDAVSAMEHAEWMIARAEAEEAEAQQDADLSGDDEQTDESEPLAQQDAELASDDETIDEPEAEAQPDGAATPEDAPPAE
jgi:small subunit ribosomal protein S1